MFTLRRKVASIVDCWWRVYETDLIGGYVVNCNGVWTVKKKISYKLNIMCPSIARFIDVHFYDRHVYVKMIFQYVKNAQRGSSTFDTLPETTYK